MWRTLSKEGQYDDCAPLPELRLNRFSSLIRALKWPLRVRAFLRSTLSMYGERRSAGCRTWKNLNMKLRGIQVPSWLGLLQINLSKLSMTSNTTSRYCGRY